MKSKRETCVRYPPRTVMYRSQPGLSLSLLGPRHLGPHKAEAGMPAGQGSASSGSPGSPPTPGRPKDHNPGCPRRRP